MRARPWIRIDLRGQRLDLVEEGDVLATYPVSTAAKGPGESMGSGCTPRGLHEIRARIGEGAPEGAVFVGRRATGEIFSAGLASAEPDRDWILTRILWLSWGWWSHGCRRSTARRNCGRLCRKRTSAGGRSRRWITSKPVRPLRCRNLVHGRNPRGFKIFE